MNDSVFKMFEEAYSARSSVFGEVPTKCVEKVAAFLEKGSRIIDLGCGDGRDSLYLLANGFNVMAIDISPAAIKSLVTKAREGGYANLLDARVLNVLDWDAENTQFDGIIGVTILDHLPQRMHSQLLDIIYLAVKDGGYIALEMHSDRDRNDENPNGSCSEFTKAIVSKSPANYLVNKLIRGWRVLYYDDRIEPDCDHGDFHYHGFVSIVAQKEKINE